jgi:hypothetical protein
MVMTRHTCRTASRAFLAAFGLFALASIGGCTTSPWESTYNGLKLEGGGLAADRVVVRDVPWERYETTQTELETMRAASTVHKDEWPAEKKAEYKTKLMQGLQVSENPSTVEILGSSMFKSTDALRPNNGELAKFASKIGATRVVWASRGLGKRSIVVREPVWTYTTGSDFFRDQPDGRRRSSTYTEATTTWVPVVIETDETAWIAYFLRIPGDVNTAASTQGR